MLKTAPKNPWFPNNHFHQSSLISSPHHQRLREASEKAKCELSSTSSTDINLPFITADASGPKHLTMTLTRAKLEKLVNDLLERTKQPCHQCMKDAGVTPKDINEAGLISELSRSLSSALPIQPGLCPLA